MKLTSTAADMFAGNVSEDTQWEFRSALNALAAAAPADLSDKLLMATLASIDDQLTFNRLFEEVFRRYSRRVEIWCFKYARNKERARDLTQEVFLKAFRNIRKFRGDAQLSTWLYVIARNHCLNSLKKSKNEPEGNTAESPLRLMPTSGDDAHEALERTQSVEEVYRFISGILTPVEIRVMTLHYVHELTLATITRRLMLSNRSGAKAAIVSARRKLKLAFQNQNDPAKISPRRNAA